MFARTRRLTLRPGWPEDAEALAAAIAHEAVVMRLSRVPWPYTLDHARDWLARAPDPAEPVFLLCAHDGPGEPRLIGCMGLHREDDAHEIGYWLTPSAWGRGYATEAGRAVLAAARTLPIARLRSRHHHDNPASGRVLAKLGFVPTGEIRRVVSLAQGREVDTVIMEPGPPALPIAARG